MDLQEYTHLAARTAQPAAYDRAYLVPMIVGETGELFGQRAKAVWHGWDAAKLELELVSEYGDIAWGTAILLKVEGIHYDKVQFPPLRQQGPTVWGRQQDPWQHLLTKAHDVYLFNTQEETSSYVRGAAQQLWLALQHHSLAITGRDFDHVLQVNLDKLASRAARGTLVGAGDHR